MVVLLCSFVGVIMRLGLNLLLVFIFWMLMLRVWRVLIMWVELLECSGVIS